MKPCCSFKPLSLWDLGTKHFFEGNPALEKSFCEHQVNTASDHFQKTKETFLLENAFNQKHYLLQISNFLICFLKKPPSTDWVLIQKGRNTRYHMNSLAISLQLQTYVQARWWRPQVTSFKPWFNGTSSSLTFWPWHRRQMTEITGLVQTHSTSATSDGLSLQQRASSLIRHQHAPHCQHKTVRQAYSQSTLCIMCSAKSDTKVILCPGLI